MTPHVFRTAIVLVIASPLSYGDALAVDRAADPAASGGHQRVQASEIQGSNPVQVADEVRAINRVVVGDAEHVLLNVRTENGTNLAVDLGAAGRLAARVSIADRVAVRGPMITNGNTAILASEFIEVDTSHTDAQRTAETITGTISEVRNITVRDRKHVIIVLEASGRQHLVDAGPVANFNLALTRQTVLSAYGVLRQVNRTRMLAATRIQYNNQVYSIDRRVHRR
jgi:hypothetical protein